MKKKQRRERPAEPEPLVLPKKFPAECPVCGEKRVFVPEAMKGDIELETLGGKIPALWAFEYRYHTPLYPVKLLAIGDVCIGCGTPRTIILDKLKGPPLGRGLIIPG